MAKKRVGTHPRNTGPMMEAQRCGARTRAGTPCRSPAVHGKKRCRMHGGASGSGAPKGNANAFKHGLYTREAIAQRRELYDLLREARETLREIR
ncbi:HGGxSTG domain-containing protein [Altererythrobacter sp. GH1-8]|uniref:HGGxSTG domain-containing protein n=1 Tax=Altererythrobacter sp. GH1-8 TaxID=3349333 RepID=UPI00374D8162